LDASQQHIEDYRDSKLVKTKRLVAKPGGTSLLSGGPRGSSRVHAFGHSQKVQYMLSGPPTLKTHFSPDNMLNLNQQNLRLKAHVLLFLKKLEGFIGKAHVMKEEKRK
jgi:hypothetical protein